MKDLHKIIIKLIRRDSQDDNVDINSIYNMNTETYNEVMVIIKLLKYDCMNHNDTWYASKFFSKEKIDRDFLSTNYCSFNVSSLSRDFCDNCKWNLKKIATNFNEKHKLIFNWEEAYVDENINLNTIKKIQTYKNWNEGKNTNHPNWYINTDLRRNRIWNGYKVYVFDDYCTDELDNYIEILNEYDIIVLAWYFNGKLEPLLKLPHIKGLVFGRIFNQDISILKELQELEFICVSRNYNRHIDNEIWIKIYSE